MPVVAASPAGSSPLTRGKRSGRCSLPVSFGLIPAHAGKTLSRVLSWITPPAHPRSRGENLLQASERRPGRRLIPAHAGKTRSPHPYRNGGRAHPRSRGENEAVTPPLFAVHGSSPLTRGKLGRLPLRERVRGLIPAHAGKTSWLAMVQRPPAAHPRSRGENASVPSSSLGMTGSSPLTRGKRHLVRVIEIVGRLIPAHAGKTKSVIMTGVARAAHPRSRGENREHSERVDEVRGSSPLTRGKHLK